MLRTTSAYSWRSEITYQARSGNRDLDFAEDKRGDTAATLQLPKEFVPFPCVTFPPPPLLYPYFNNTKLQDNGEGCRWILYTRSTCRYACYNPSIWATYIRSQIQLPLLSRRPHHPRNRSHPYLTLQQMKLHPQTRSVVCCCCPPFKYAIP